MSASSPTTSGGLLIVGGSQGAHAVNELVAGALEILVKQGRRFPVLHQTGTTDRDPIAARYVAAGLDVDVRPFIDDMASAYRDAHLVVARAGASTLAELTTLGVPSILIPFPYAADDHQTANARDLESAGAARVMVQADTTAAQLATAIGELMSDDARRAKMGHAARALGRPDAHRDITDALLGLVK
jgi:UDP-N-acetylglucosamine--N-acetylmuramyl-(pentapeptide) pyrophosphoryl-undecaprenol N-acetylglucosamine transferase